MTAEQSSFIETVYRENYSLLMSSAMAALGDPSLAQDIVQITFHAMVEQIETDNLMAHPNIRGWLRLVMKNKLKMYYREQTYHYEYLLPLNGESLPDPGVPDKQIERINQDFAGEVAKIQKALTPEEFQFLVRLVVDRTSHLELAKEYHITVYGIKKKRERILHKLHKKFPDMTNNFR